MKIIKVHIITATDDQCLMVDIEYPDHLGTSRVIYAYRQNDIYSSLTQQIKKWIEGNEYIILPFVSPSSEEIREYMQPITRRQLRPALVRHGISLAQVEQSIAAMSEGHEKQEAEIEWQDASQFNRMHPTLLLVADVLNLTPEQLDVMWEYAQAI